jgi:hypothetical protein
LPEGVQALDDPDTTIASVAAPKVEAEEQEAAEAPSEG